ncbi:MAG: Ig-like domain-containing protein [Lachnotalea sp.]
MKKLLSRALAMLLTSTIVFSSTGYTTLAANFSPNSANVYTLNSVKTSTDRSGITNTTEEVLDVATTTDSSVESTTDATVDSTADSSLGSTTDSNLDSTADTSADSTTDSTTDTNADSTESTLESNDNTSENVETTDESNVSTTSTDSTITETSSELNTNDSTTTDGEQSMTTTTQTTSTQTTSTQTTSTTMEAEHNSTNEASNYTWQGITFGQSTDLNFQSTILPDKIGTQYADKTQISVIDSSVTDAEPVTKDAVVIESRGGKIANAHDGLTYYYTTLPTSKNFVLEAKVFINQFGPENGNTPNKQEAAGIMARDVISAARQNPMLDGYEELPAASNTAVTMIQANEKKSNTALNITSYQRNGVFYPYGNAHVSYSSTKFASVNTDKLRTVTDDITPADGENYESSDFFTLRLERTNDGFITTYIDADGNEINGSIDDADRLAIIDEDNMYIGFFSSRNAKVTYSDIYLETSDANTAPCSFTPAAYDLAFINLSNTETSSSNYTIAFRANFDGTAEIMQDSSVIESAGNVTAGKIYELPTTLTNSSTDFTINYNSAGGTTTENFTVLKNEAYKKDLYVSTEGTSDGTGNIDSPLDLTTALNYLSEGYTLYLRAGTYGALKLESTQSGSSNGNKTLAAYNNEDVVFSGNSYVKSSYWILNDISITGSNSAGMRVYGSSNIINSCTFYENEDTGLQLGTGSDSDPLTWPENNLVKYCTSYNNIDASNINADGFAAKLGVGVGNVFDSCISYNNADDGWDLFNKLGDAKNKPVTIQNCIAYGNGNNGFKLGGEGYAVDHVVTNSLAYANGLDGFTCNFNTGVLTITNCTSVDNKRYNYIFRLNPYKTVEEQGIFTNNISFRTDYDANSSNDYISGNINNSYFFNDGNKTITSADFISVTAPTLYERNEDNTINYGDYMRPTASSFLATTGVGDSTYLGAITPIIPVTINVAKITLSDSSASLKLNQTLSLSATVSPSDATNSSITWTSSNPAVASVDSNGTVTAITVGTTAITATANDTSTISSSCNITVESNIINVSSIELSSTTLTLRKSGNAVIAATILPSNSTDPSIIWTSSNSKVATVDTTGKVTGTSYGTTTITATANDNSSIAATCKVVVGYKITYKLYKGTNSDNNPTAYYNQKVKLSAPTRAGYTFSGWYTDSKFTQKVSVIKKGTKKNYKVYAKWEKVTKPDSPTIKSVTNSGKSKMKVTLKSTISDATGYQVTYATNKKFTKNKTSVIITKSSTKSKTIKKLAKRTKYYVKVRSYKIDSAGNKIYSKYSSITSIKIKK